MSGFAAAAVVAAVLAVVALISRNDAARQSGIAQANETAAESSAALAEEKATEAETERANAQASTEFARSRELAAAAITELDRDPELSLLLAIKAAEQAEPTIESTSALREALSQHRAILTYTWPSDRTGGFLWGDISEDGRLLVVAANGGGLTQMLNIDDGSLAWELDLGSDIIVFQPFFVEDSSQVVVPALYIGDGTPPEGFAGLRFLDSATGEEIRKLEVGECGVVQAGFWDTSDDFAFGLAPPCGPPEGPVSQYRIDLATGETTEITEGFEFRMNASDDETRIVVSGSSEPLYVMDATSREKIFVAPDDVYEQIADISPDGERIVYLRDRAIEVVEVTTGTVLSRYFGHGLAIWNAWFSEDGQTMYSSGPDGTFQTWDPDTGENLLTVPYGDVVFWSAVTPDLTRAAAFSGGESVKVFDLTSTFNPAAITYPVVADCDNPQYWEWSLQVLGDRATVLVECQNDVTSRRAVVFSIVSGETIGEVIPADGSVARLSPDGTMLAAQRTQGGITDTVVIYDAETGAELRVMEGLCRRSYDRGESDESAEPGCNDYPTTPFVDRPTMFRFSPDGKLLAMVSRMNQSVSVWNVDSGEMVATWPTTGNAMGIDFSLDGAQLLVGSTAELAIYSSADWSVQMSRSWDDSGGSAPGRSLHFTSDGMRIVAAADPFWGNSDIFVLNSQTLETITRIEQSHDGGVVTLDVSSDDQLVASVGTDGFARVWDLRSGGLVAEIPIAKDEQANNVQFISDDRQLIVTSLSGPVTIVTIDNEDLLRLARSRLTRTFTDRECVTYRIDPCPTLDETTNG